MDLCDSSSSPEARGGLRILIVEDLADSAQSTALLLRLYGHQVTISANGCEGVELALSEKPDVVLIDIGLPDMDGHAVARKISETREARTPLLIAITGFGQDADRHRSAEAGIDLHLLKPVEPAVLESILRAFQTEIYPPD